MKVEQRRYLSPEASVLRQRDGTPPWGVHPCELDSLGAPAEKDRGPFAQSLRAAIALREEIEGR